MTQIELNKVLDEHKNWLETDGEEGKRADLSYADLRYTNLRDVDLSYVNLRSANLRSADLIEADLRDADLRDADLRYTDLSYANLTGANLSGANLDYSAFPLWCGGLDVHIDDRQATQLLYHLVRNVLYSKNTSKELKKLLGSEELIEQANKFHRAEERGKLGIENE